MKKSLIGSLLGLSSAIVLIGGIFAVSNIRSNANVPNKEKKSEISSENIESNYVKYADMYSSDDSEYYPHILYDNPQNDYERMWNEVSNAPTKEESNKKLEILLNSSFTQDGKLISSGSVIYNSDGEIVGKTN